MKFRTIGQRKRQVFSEPVNTSAIVGDGGVRNQGIITDQAKQILGALASQQAANNQFRTQNLQTLNNNDLANTQLRFNALAAADGIKTQNARLQGAQALRNQQLANQWYAETERLAAIQEAEAAQAEIQQQQVTNTAITGLGESLVNFSQSLWERKAQEVNEANQQAASRAIIDTMLGRNPKVDASTFESIDALKTGDLIRSAEGEALAQQLEADGLVADANEIRSRNPYYLYQVAELQAMQFASDLPGLMEETRSVLSEKYRGQPNADFLVEKGLRDVAQQAIIDSGLDQLPPDIVARYVGKNFIDSISTQVRIFRRENSDYLKDGRKRVALVEAQTSIPLWADDPEEFKRNILNLQVNSGDDVEKQLLSLTNSAYQYGTETGDFSALDMLANDELVRYLSPNLATAIAQKKEQYNEEFQRKQRQESKERADGLIAEMYLQIRQLNPGDFAGEARIKEEYYRMAESLGLSPEDLMSVAKAADQASITGMDGRLVKDQIDTIISTTRKDKVYSVLMARAGAEPNAEIAEAYRRAAKPYSLIETDPRLKNAVEGARAQIDVLAARVPIKVGTPAEQEVYKESIKAIAEYRKNQLDLRIDTWIRGTQGAKDADSMLEWFRDKNNDLLKDDFADEDGKLVDLPKLTAQRNSVSKTSGVPVYPYQGGKKKGPILVSPVDRKKALSGEYGSINSNDTRVLTEQEVAWASEHYERTGEHQQIVKALARRANVSPGQLLENQAEIYELQGSLATSPNLKPNPGYTRRVTFDWIRNQAESAGLSRMGSIWLATQAWQESSGDPNAVGDKNNPTGNAFGMFQMRMDRQDALNAHAKSLGLPPNDARAQVSHAINEIQTQYPVIWQLLKAPNPSIKDLLDASHTWLRYDSANKSKRARELLYNLQNMD